MSIAGAAGGAVAIGAMEALSHHTAFPLMFVPFATSIVLVMGTPDAGAGAAPGPGRRPPDLGRWSGC